MTDQLMAFAYVTPMLAILGLFWNVARKLGSIEVEVKHLRKENTRLENELLSLRALLSVVIDSRRD